MDTIQKDIFTRIIEQTIIEGVKQKLDRVAWVGKKVAPIGISTEELFRNELGSYFKDVTFSNKLERPYPLILSPADAQAIKAQTVGGQPCSDKDLERISPPRGWSQCDLYCTQTGRSIFSGEIKTTTSAFQNYAHLINICLTCLSGQGPSQHAPLIIIFPDAKPATLRKNMGDVIRSAISMNKVDSSVEQEAKNSIFILTKSTWKSDVKTKRFETIHDGKWRELLEKDLSSVAVYESLKSRLFNPSVDIDWGECDRLWNYLQRLTNSPVDSRNGNKMETI
jgi:hypothetical protein